MLHKAQKGGTFNGVRIYKHNDPMNHLLFGDDYYIFLQMNYIFLN